MTCPHCRVELAEGLAECPACGLIFSKWKERPARPELPGTPAAPPGFILKTLAASKMVLCAGLCLLFAAPILISAFEFAGAVGRSERGLLLVALGYILPLSALMGWIAWIAGQAAWRNLEIVAGHRPPPVEWLPLRLEPVTGAPRRRTPQWGLVSSALVRLGAGRVLASCAVLALSPIVASRFVARGGTGMVAGVFFFTALFMLAVSLVVAIHSGLYVYFTEARAPALPVELRQAAAEKAALRTSFSTLAGLYAVSVVLVLPSILKFGELVRKGSEGASKGNLGGVRSALSIYYGDLEGLYPDDPLALTVNAKYLASFPRAKAPNYHVESSAIQRMTDADVAAGRFSDAGGWAYAVPAASSAMAGTLFVNCTHTDTRGTVWTHY